jgi:hypothetical protein
MRVHTCPCLLKSPSRYSQFNFLLLWTIGLLYFYTLLLNESTTYFWGHYRWHKRIQKIDCGYKAGMYLAGAPSGKTRGFEWLQCTNCAARNDGQGFGFSPGACILCISHSYPIYIPSCPRLGNKALDDKKDFKLQPKRIILGLKWHRWHWHFWVSTGILPRRWRPMLPLSTRGVSGPWHWNHGGMVQVELRELSRRAGTSSAS